MKKLLLSSLCLSLLVLAPSCYKKKEKKETKKMNAKKRTNSRKKKNSMNRRIDVWEIDVEDNEKSISKW